MTNTVITTDIATISNLSDLANPLENMTAEMSEREAIKALDAHITATGKTQAEAARELGVSGGMISLFLKGAYKTPHTLIPKIEQYLKINERKQATPKEPSFKMTSISREVMNVITYCHLQGKIGVAYGDAGIGKTMAVREYVKNNPEAVLLTISPCYATITGVNELLSEELKIKEKIARRIFTEAVNKLKGSNRVIIIDEAQHLTVRVINHLRSITDESGIGIAFVGNEEIYLKMRGAGQSAYAQLFSRIGYKSHVFTSQIKESDIKLIFEDAGLAGDAIAELHGISKTHYGLRGAVNVFVNTIIGFQIENYCDISASRLKSMRVKMGIA